jgi:hypothetical protein
VPLLEHLFELLEEQFELGAPLALARGIEQRRMTGRLAQADTCPQRA